MEQTPPTLLRREFRHRTEAEFQRRLSEQQRQERERKDRRERKDEAVDDFVEMAVAALTETEVATFRAELDTYDEATVIALQENTEALALVQDRIDEILSQAHVLPDGRRVFKTEDGRNVFDELGNEVDSDTIDPDTISDSLASWETFKALVDRRRMLGQQRDEILTYQAKLDDARERLDSGEMTRDEYDELRNELKRVLPETVRSHVKGLGADEPSEPETKTAEAEELDLSDIRVPTSMAPPQL